ncbi:proteolipid protein 1a [Brachionichthys hirsutus]|uniref:proteolipid protein 1a n=1 Tax=Brachionichthys hirsutus TaxID=412623 RepID=UPI0036045ECC
MGCYDCCLRCLGRVPYCSLAATLLCFSGIALFCGCGHQALTETERLIETYFARNLQDYITLAYIIQYFQYFIYGLASFFFLYCIVLLAEGFYTTSAAKQTFGEFRSTMCGRCLSSSFIVITYCLAALWMLVFAFSALPVYFCYNMDATCRTIDVLTETPASINQLCVDARQYGLLPWNAVPGKACGITLSTVCKTREYRMTYDLYIAAFSGAGITLLALVLCSLNLAVSQVYVRRLRRRAKEESRGYSLYGRLQRDSGATLCSPYLASSSEICQPL